MAIPSCKHGVTEAICTGLVSQSCICKIGDLELLSTYTCRPACSQLLLKLSHLGTGQVEAGSITGHNSPGVDKSVFVCE